MSINELKLYDIADNYLSALTEFAENDESEIPDQVWLDTLEALEGSLIEKGQNVTAFILTLGKKSDMIGERIKELQARKKAMENKQEWFRNYLKTNMEKAGISKIEANDGSFTATLGKASVSCIVDDAEKLPKKYVEKVITLKVDKVSLKKDIEAGLETEGAHLEYNPRLTIRG